MCHCVQCVICSAQQTFEVYMCGGNVCNSIEGCALHSDTNPVDSKELCSPAQTGWGSGTFSLWERMLSFHIAGHKPAHNYRGLENFPCGQTTLWQPVAVPPKHLLTAAFRNQGLAWWTIRLILCDNSYALFQPGSSGERWCWLRSQERALSQATLLPAKPRSKPWTGSSAGLFEAGNSCWDRQWMQANGTMDPALCRPCSCQSTCQVVFWGMNCSVCIKLSAIV